MSRSLLRHLLVLIALALPLAAQDLSISSPGAGPYAIRNLLTFSCSATSSITNPVWTFGDGASASGQTVTHSYAGSGTFTVTFSASVQAEMCKRWGMDNEGNPICLKSDFRWTAESVSRTVQILPNPVITAFSANPAIIQPGQAVTLGWNSSGATSMILKVGSGHSGQVQDVSQQTAISENPTQTSTYTLTASNGLGVTDERSVTVTVVALASIASFNSNRTLVTAGKTVVLSMAFTGNLATIDGVAGSWSSSPAQVVVTVPATTTYLLRVRDAAGGSSVQNLTVTAVAPPQIDGFTANPAVISAGAFTGLVASFQNGEGRIDPVVGPVSSGADNPVQPGATTTYTLTVTNAAQDQVQSWTTVRVPAAPSIQQFSVDSRRLPPEGGVSWLYLSYQGGTASVTPDIGTWLDPNTYEVDISGETEFTLVVTNELGVQVSQSVILEVGLAMKFVRDITYLGSRQVGETDVQGYHVTLVDHLGSPRSVTDLGGALQSSQKYLPFGEMLDQQGSLITSKGFTNHEQTDASGLIYMQARMYLPTYGRFCSPDPARDQHFEDTQSWNIYSYVRNNPVMRTDPTGLAVLLTGDDQQRARQLAAAQAAVGNQAGKYLYDNKTVTKDAAGKEVTTHTIGIYTNGPDGKGPAFAGINKTAGAMAGVINDKRVAVIDLVKPGTTVRDAHTGATSLMGKAPSGNPGATTPGTDGMWHINLLDQGNKGTVPGGYMSNGKSGYIDTANLTAHEFGHLHGVWFPSLFNRIFGPERPGATDGEALDLENDARTRRNPDAATRTDH